MTSEVASRQCDALCDTTATGYWERLSGGIPHLSNDAATPADASGPTLALMSLDKFRGDLGMATGDTSEHVKGRAEEAKGNIQKDFGGS